MKEESKPTVIGCSIINHNARVKLGITVSEYTLLQFFQGLYEDGMQPEEFVCWSQLGISIEVAKTAMKTLMDKKLLSNDLKPFDLWYKIHKEKGFEFGLFWQPVTIGDDTVEWRDSSKVATRKKLFAALKEVPIEQLIYAKLRYFFSKWESRSFDYVMGAERFLGPDKLFNIRYSLKHDTEIELNGYINKFYGTEGTINLLSFMTTAGYRSDAPVNVNTEGILND